MRIGLSFIIIKEIKIMEMMIKLTGIFVVLTVCVIAVLYILDMTTIVIAKELVIKSVSIILIVSLGFMLTSAIAGFKKK